MMLRRFLPCLAAVALYLAQSTSAAQDWLYYARKGDTLWKLCLKYTNKRGCWLELAKYNDIDQDRQIPVGTLLRIPLSWLNQPVVVGRVLNIVGRASVQRNEAEPRQLLEQEELHLGDKLMSNKGSIYISLSNGSKLLLRPNSTLQLDSLTDQDTTPQVGGISVPQGTAEISVVPGRDTRFEVQTPAAIAAVRGTQYRVTSHAEGPGETRVEVLAGRVEVAAGASVELGQDEGISASVGSGMGEVVALPPPPTMLDARYDGPIPVELRWQEVTEAAGGQLDLHPESGSGAVL
ncbi:MAG: FecR domain-containing protein, partial [Parahaliea sp.]